MASKAVLRQLTPDEFIKCLNGAGSFPDNSRDTQNAWKRALFFDGAARIMKSEDKKLSDSNSILRVSQEELDMEQLARTISSEAPHFFNMLITLMESGKASRAVALSMLRQHLKDMRVAFIVLQLLFSRSQQLNSVQSFLGVQFKFSGMTRKRMNIPSQTRKSRSLRGCDRDHPRRHCCAQPPDGHCCCYRGKKQSASGGVGTCSRTSMQCVAG